MHFVLSLTFVHQSSWSCCSNPALRLSRRPCCACRQTRTIYRPLMPLLLLPPPHSPPSRGTTGPGSESPGSRRCGGLLLGNLRLWGSGSGNLERSPGSLHDRPWTARAHRGKQRAAGRSSTSRPPGSSLTSVQKGHRAEHILDLYNQRLNIIHLIYSFQSKEFYNKFYFHFQWNIHCRYADASMISH